MTLDEIRKKREFASNMVAEALKEQKPELWRFWISVEAQWESAFQIAELKSLITVKGMLRL